MTSSKPRERVLDVAHRLLDVAARTSFVGVELRLLRQEADLDAGLRPRLAFELLVDAGHDPEQRRFARAVEAEHADLRAGKKLSEMSRRMTRFGGTTFPTRFMV